MKNVVIVGGSGFIGQNLVERLLRMATVNSVGIIDPVVSQSIYAPKIRTCYYPVVEVRSSELAGVDTVIHLASNPDIAAAIKDPGVDFCHGTMITHQVLELCRLAGVKRLIYASGSGVYGEDPFTVFKEDHGPCRPISPYGASKLAGEAMISSYCHLFGLSAMAFRFANVVGPHQTHGVGYDFMRRLKKNPQELSILGDGSQSKAYIHVEDVIEAVLLANGNHQTGFDVFNVSTQDNLSVAHIATMAAEVSGLNPASVDFKYSGGNRGWAGDVPKVRLDSGKIRKLGWRNLHSSSSAMRMALEDMV